MCNITANYYVFNYISHSLWHSTIHVMPKLDLQVLHKKINKACLIFLLMENCYVKELGIGISSFQQILI